MNRIVYVFLTAMTFLTACAPSKTLQTSEMDTTKLQPKTEQPTKPLNQTEQTKASKNITVPSSFELSGAIAARNHKKGWTATLNWMQKGPSQYQIRLIGPLGGQTVMIEKQGSVITYREDAKKVTSTNGDDLLQKQTGIHLPVNNLYYWVRGIPAPGAVQSTTHNPTGQLSTLKQAGYTIDYNQYMPVGNATLPSKIRLQGHDLMIKLIIKHWNV
ncbi:MAG: lipoprotein insertase outer membrane protein LolB [Legionellaceae bacterium]|nr:lipoprotein insertase outer membrane protein LolB [Legionellaceae bacterium]